MTRVLIDCDPGLDDAVALLAAFGSDALKIAAVTTVAGNVKGSQTAKNALTICSLMERARGVPVHAGAPAPLFRAPVTAEDFHGTTGLGGLDFPTPNMSLNPMHAVNAIIQACSAGAGEGLTILCTGPMTNLALALRMSPHITAGIAEVIVMAGADVEGGNITEHAEFNVFADPHAAAIVLSSDLPVRCLSLDVTHQLRTTPERLAQVRRVNTVQAKVAADLLESSCKLEFSANGSRDAPLHDPSTVLALLHPEIFSGRKVHVAVTTETGPKFGRTRPSSASDGNVMWYERVDADAAFDALCHLLGART